MTAAEILDKLRDLRVLVVGDIVLDRWCEYDPVMGDVSRETGLTRIGVTAVEGTPGAGGTVANNLAALGVRQVRVLGIVGDDGHGLELRKSLHARGITHEFLVSAPDFHTFTYTKLINKRSGEEDLPRLDFINTNSPPDKAQQQLLSRLDSLWTDSDVVIVADQAETETGGVITAEVRKRISGFAQRDPGKQVWVDSRLRIDQFRHVIAKPNRAEADAACNRIFGQTNYARLRAHLEAPVLLVTDGQRGARVVESTGEHHVPTRAISEPVDICGAGDSFTAGAACAYAVTGSAVQAAGFGNLVASVTIMQKGTGAASREQVLAAERQ